MINPSIYSETEKIPLHGREKQEVERYFLRLKILLRNISPYIYISVPFTKFKGMQNKK